MRHLHFDERGGPRTDRLSPETVAALSASRVFKIEQLDDGRHVIELTGNRTTVGAGTFGDATVIVKPKIQVKRILFLLAYARNPGWQDELVGLEETPSLVAALAYAFVDRVERVLAGGVLQGYVPVERSLTVLRGRLREQQQLRQHHGLPVPLAVRFEDHTVDILENRLLQTAAQRLLRTPGVPDRVRGRLERLSRRSLASVTALDCGSTPPTWAPTRLNHRYRAVLPLAEVVIRGGSLDQAPGTVPLNGFFFDMEKVYEDFVTVALTEALHPHGGWCRPQDRHPFDASGLITLVPDLVWRVDQQPVAVIDAKYKARKESRQVGIPKEDIFQMFTYCGAIGATDGHLVYAKGETAVDTYEVERAGITIHVHVLDLDTAPDDLLAQVDAVSVKIAAHRPERRAG